MENRCGDCNVCCKVCSVPEIDKPHNTICQYYKNGGCSIYETRPTKCSNYKCLWLTQNIPDDYRPDKLGVLFEQANDRVWVGIEVKAESLNKYETARIVNSLNKLGNGVFLKGVDGKFQHSLPENMVLEELIKEYTEGLQKILSRG